MPFCERAERHNIHYSFLSSSKALALCELAPFQQMLTVAGFHRAHPSTTLNKSHKNILSFKRLFKKSGENDTSLEDLRLSTDTSCVERRSHHILWKLVGLLFRSSRINCIRSGTHSFAASNFLVLFILLFKHAL